VWMIMKAAGPARWNPTQAKTGLEWGTHHLLPVERGVLPP
jgi:hypothetical protein